MQAVLSQNQVFITCSNPQEAENLKKAVENVPQDQLDDLINLIPILKEEIGNLKKDNLSLLEDNQKAGKEIEKLLKENSKLTAKLEKPLGKSKKGK